METILFKSKEQKTAQEAAAALRQIAEKLEGGQISLKRGEKEVILQVPANLVLEMKVEEEQKGQQVEKKLEIEMEWIEGGPQKNEPVAIN